MRILWLLALIPWLSFAEGAPADAQSFNDQDMIALVNRIGADLRKCPQLKKGAEVDVAVQNATQEFLDKDAFTKALQGQIPPSASGPGKKYDLAAKLSETVKSKAGVTEGTYTLTATLKQAEEVLCRKTEKLVKKGH